MTDVRVIDAGDNLLVTGQDERQVAATLQKFVMRGARALGQPQLVGRSWSASCSKPVNYYSEPSTLDVGSAPPTNSDAFSNVTVSEMGQKVLVSGRSKAAVQLALDELKKLGARNISSIAQVGISWIATCDDPPSAIDECTVDVFGAHRMVTGTTKEAVETRVKTLTDHVGTLVKIEEAPDGKWVALIDDSGPTKW